MKPEIDFYLLKHPKLEQCLDFTCQLTSKVYQQGNNLKIECDTQALLTRLDQQLWQYRDDSFIPHQLSNNKSEAHENCILLIGAHDLIAADINLQINMHLNSITVEPPPWQRLLQIVPNEPDALQSARQHYRHYKQAGYQLRNHNISL